MFKRVLVEDWVHIVPVLSFCIFFSIFIIVTIRALRIKRSERERMAAMPLESDPSPQTIED